MKSRFKRKAREYSLHSRRLRTNARDKSVLVDDYHAGKSNFMTTSQAIGMRIKHPVRFAEELRANHGEFIGYTAKTVRNQVAFTDKAIGGVRISSNRDWRRCQCNLNARDRLRFNKRGSINVDPYTDVTIKAQQEIVKNFRISGDQQ